MVRARWFGLAVLIARRAGENHGLAACAIPAKHGRLIPGNCGGKQCVRIRKEPLPLSVPEHRHPPAFAGADDQIVPPVIVCVEPGHARTALAEFAWKQGLAGKIVEQLFMMGVV